MKILVGCERSGRVRDAFIARGHDAISCDIEPSDAPGPHIQGDVLEAARSAKWDMGLFFPPCTYLCGSGLHWNGRREGRAAKTAEALQLVRDLLALPIKRVALENPKGAINTAIRRPDCVIQPYQFGEDASKETSLWLHRLPPLRPTKFIEPRYVCRCKHVFEYALGKYGCPNCCGDSGAALPRWANQTDSGQNKLAPSKDRARLRGVTYRGIANAMADQWGAL